MSAANTARPRHSRRAITALMAGVIAAGLVGIWLLSADARREIDALATANADSAQWSIAQSEVELLTLETAILTAIIEGTDESLSILRRRFDVFYSRMHTLQQSSLFARVLDRPNVHMAQATATQFLDDAVPLIDGPDADLRDGLADLHRQVTEVRRALRVITLASLRVFAQDAELQRERVASALLDLAVLSIALAVVLVGTVLAVFWALSVGRRQTAEIAQAQGRLRTIVGTSLDGVLVIGEDGRIQEFNGAAERIFGYGQDEALGRHVADLIVPDHMKIAPDADMTALLNPDLRNLIDSGLVQSEAKDKYGHVFPVELSLSSVESADGSIFVSFIRDISDRIASERELVDARDKALAGEQAKAEFLAVMSHEMRTPLNGILGSLDLLSETDLSDRQKGFVEIMDSSGRMLLDHVNTVLDISRVDAGQTILRQDVFDPMDLLREIIDNQSVQAHARGNRIDLRRIGPPLGPVLGDKTRLRQCLVNLVANAVKFTKNGTITLTIGRTEETEEVEFRVIDTGIGIAPNQLPRIFDDFVTLDSSYAREVEGTGLGLGIVRRLATAMGGIVGVESTQAKGSTFWLRLPLPIAEAEAALSPAVPERIARHDRIGAGVSVLIVEDNEINRLIVREMLSALGCTTTESTDGQDGADLARKQPFDLILMDISMPRLDGITAARMIRGGDGPNARTPIVALTAHAAPAEIRRFHEAGMTDVIVKPLALARLAELLRDLRPEYPSHQANFAAPADSPLALLGSDRAADTLRRALLEIESSLVLMASLLGNSGDCVELAQVAHRAAGLAAVVGLCGLRDVLMTLELAVSELDGEDGETEALAEMIAEANRIFATEKANLGLMAT